MQATHPSPADAGTRLPSLVVRAWDCHARTAIGYLDRDKKFRQVADCSLGPDLAQTYEPLALKMAAAPELLKALQDIVAHEGQHIGSHRLHAAIAAIQKASGVAE